MTRSINKPPFKGQPTLRQQVTRVGAGDVKCALSFTYCLETPADANSSRIIIRNQGKITLHPYCTCAASMPTVYLALGTNLGDRPANLRAKMTVTCQVTVALFRIAVLFLVDVFDSYTCAGVY
jgi:hypothetical protein